MNDDIQIPVIEITDGWTVDEVHTEDDCDDAHAVLTAIIVGIEGRMDDLAMQGDEVSHSYKRAKAALRWKKAALQVVNIKRGKIKRAERESVHKDRNNRLAEYFAAMHPDEMRIALRHIAAKTDALAIATPAPEQPQERAQ